MSSVTKALVRQETTVPLILMAVAAGMLVIGLETVFHVSLRLPGHRALPGALALLLLGQTFAPLVLFGFAGAVSATLVITGHAGPAAIAVWLVAALAYWGLQHTPLARHFVYFIIGGGLFGLLRFLSLSGGFHRTPQEIRFTGHLLFGIAGGLLAFAAWRGLAQRPNRQER